MNEISKYKLKQKVDFEFPGIVSLAKRRLIQLWFGFAIILFFLNFFTVSCEGKNIVSVSGFNLVTGTNVATELTGKIADVKELKSFDEFGNIIQDDKFIVTENGGNVSSNFFAIISFTTAIISFLVYFFKSYYANRIATVLGTTSFISLIILRLTFIGNLLANTNEMFDLVVITSVAFWFALLFLLLGTFFLL